MVTYALWTVTDKRAEAAKKGKFMAFPDTDVVPIVRKPWLSILKPYNSCLAQGNDYER